MNVLIELQDSEGHSISWVVSQGADGELTETKPVGYLKSHTHCASLNQLVLTGDQWRDIESDDLDSFIKHVFVNGGDPDLYLEQIENNYQDSQRLELSRIC